MHDGMSTFFIVTTSDLIGQDSKTTKKLRFEITYQTTAVFKMVGGLKVQTGFPAIIYDTWIPLVTFYLFNNWLIFNLSNEP